jgi:radical SAM superfamily enzyme YgiQ (UPF0313 family)
MVECVKKIQAFGMEVRGGFIVGFDSDSPSVFEKQIEFIQNSRVITAMVGLLNAPKGSRLYKRIVEEGRLIKEVTGDNTDFSTNFIPKMGMDTLFQGYRQIINGIYSPKPYYERVKNYLKEYKPLKRKKLHFHFNYIRLHPGYAAALFKSVILLGIKDKARLHYWKLVFWSLFRKPLALSRALTFAIYGFHFRKVYLERI